MFFHIIFDMILYMRNIQISLDDSMLSFIDEVAESAQKTRAALIREAVASWIKHKSVERFETDWIEALRAKRPTESGGDGEAWMAAEAWEKP